MREREKERRKRAGVRERESCSFVHAQTLTKAEDKKTGLNLFLKKRLIFEAQRRCL